MSQTNFTGSSWQGSLGDLTYMVYQIRCIRAFGRLSLRNSERLSIAQLYFRAGKLAHIAGNRGNARAILNDLQDWTQGFVRFERGVTTQNAVWHNEYEQLFSDALVLLQQRGIVPALPAPRIVESKLVSSTEEIQQLVNPWEWRVLGEATHQLGTAIGRLVGLQEAFQALRDILNDCTRAFASFTCLTIAENGSLRVIDQEALDHFPREEILSGFAAFFSACEYFCAPIVGEREAHEFMLHALQDMLPSLVELDVFHVLPLCQLAGDK